MPIDFFAKETHYCDHMLPVYKALGSLAGDFFVPGPIAAHLRMRETNPFMVAGEMMGKCLSRTEPLVVASHSDLVTAYTYNHKRPIVLMEHGIGIVYPGNAAYAGNSGYRRWPVLTLAPNQIVYDHTKKALPKMEQVIIGTPKMDKWVEKRGTFKMSGEPIVAISFHWDGSTVAPEAGSAFQYFKKEVIALSKLENFRLIGHAHPKAVQQLEPFYKQNNIQFVKDFEDVLELADIYVCDNSSTIYEFIVTGKPVIILNSPAYRQNISTGIRFWDYTDIGYMVNEPELLRKAIENTIFDVGYGGDPFFTRRFNAVKALFPHLGYSARFTADVLEEKFAWK